MVEAIDWTGISFSEARETLKKWREEHARRSEETVEIWEHVLSRYGSSLGDELWPVLEQVTLAAIDAARHDLVLECLQKLIKKFPASGRVTKLQAMRLEAEGKFDAAEEIYDKLIKADEANPSFRKRKVAILIAKGERLEAIRELNSYLEIFLNDQEAWQQLCELYLKEGDYARAAFAFEDVLLSNPHSSLSFRRMAEIRYASGGTENLELSKAYFERAILMSENDIRSLYGLILVCNALSAKASPSKKKELSSAGVKAADKLIEIYRASTENDHIEVHIKTITTLKNQLKQIS
uniref:ER membrane protein complex subunit 2 n=1 Tax=Panagrolaimus davidi TaxID=227884 RepID=A0A914Q2D0_9BILA